MAMSVRKIINHINLHTYFIKPCSKSLMISLWHNEETKALLSPNPDVSPSAESITRCLNQLSQQGFTKVFTSALLPHQSKAFIDCGFQIEKKLAVLSRDLESLPYWKKSSTYNLRRATRKDRSKVLEVDSASFPQFWRLTNKTLAEAIHATSYTRFEIATPIESEDIILGYAITGQSEDKGFLQRLAVNPTYQHLGIGKSLVLDGLWWLKKRGATKITVNTEVNNFKALCLYHNLGFALQPTEMHVLSTKIN